MSELKTSTEMLEEFITKFDASRDPELWLKLIEEEAEELRQAGLNLIKELADLIYVLAGYETVAGYEKAYEIINKLERELFIPNPILENMIEAIPDSNHFASLNRVHASNMSKLGDDGKPIRREDGKILKGPNYKPPVLDDLLS